MLGRPDEALALGLRRLGLAPMVDDGDVVVWSRRLRPLPPPPPSEPPTLATPPGLLMTIADAAVTLGVGRSTMYELIGRGELEVVHIGRCARVPTEAVRALVERLRAGLAPKGWPLAGVAERSVRAS